MPKSFTKCIKQGGKVRTVSKGKKYFRICKTNKGKWIKGHSKTKK